MRLPLLALHISTGIIGLLSGAAAISVRKGSERHRAAGNVFLVSMLIMGLCASCLAVLKHQMNNVFGGLLTVYMVATAWSTARRRGNGTSALDWAALLFAAALGASILTLGLLVLNGKAAPQAGVPIGMYFFMASAPLLAAVGDVRMLVRGGISGRPRLIRHLWRMCFGLFIATGSFFLGQEQVFPALIRKQYLLAPLAILPFPLMIFWLLRVWFAKQWIGGYFPRNQGHTRA
jgi:uncharacterized membrane protein